MSNGARRTQHKPQRDEGRAKELAELKKENRVLRKALARSRKQILKLMEIHAGQEEGQEHVAPKPSKRGCEACGSSTLAAVVLPTGTLIACKSCGHRKVEKHE